MLNMSVEGDRRSRVLENNIEQHLGILDPQTPVSQTGPGSSLAHLMVETSTPVKEKIFHLLVVCVELLLLCAVLVLVVHSFLWFIQSLAKSDEFPCPVNRSYPLNPNEFLPNITVERPIRGN